MPDMTEVLEGFGFQDDVQSIEGAVESDETEMPENDKIVKDNKTGMPEKKKTKEKDEKGKPEEEKTAGNKVREPAELRRSRRIGRKQEKSSK